MVTNNEISALIMVNKPLQRHIDDSLPYIKESYFLEPKLSTTFWKEIKTTNS